MNKAWKKWVKITKRIASYLASIILTIVYFLLIIPLSYAIKTVHGRSLLGHARIEKKNSYWLKRSKHKYNLTEAYKQ